MAVATERFRQGDVYIDYEFEEVLFRYDFRTRRCFRRFYGELEEDEVPHDNRLLNEAICAGKEIDAVTYQKGRPRT